ncbi:MAG: hypothetical protein ACLQBA_10860 [Candidatus Binataceae bacterium]
MTAEQEPKTSEVASEREWPKFMARMMEDITRSELHRFEANLAAALRIAVDRAIANLFLLASAVVGGGCLIAALVLLLGQWLPWWLSFALPGLAIVGIGQIIYARHKKPARFYGA